MTVTVLPLDAFQDLSDGPGVLTQADDGLIPQWDNAQRRFRMAKLPSPTRSRGGTVIAAGPGGLFTIRFAGDGPGEAGAADDGKVLTWNTAAQRFVLAAVAGGGDADTLDGLDSTAFALAGHSHAPGDADTLDGHDSLYFATADHTHPAGDAATLDGHDSTYFATAAHTHGLVDLDDVDITPGAGVDGYSVIYDHASGTFILSDVTGGGGYTNEQAQDAVGTILLDSTTLDFTYDDATPSITADVKAGSISSTHLADGAALAEILDDDGTGSLLDADLLDGQHAADFAAVGHSHAAGDATTLDGIDSTGFALVGHTHEVDQRADMFNDIEGDPSDVAAIEYDGASIYASRRDHIHAIAPGTVTATMLEDGAALAEILDDDGAGSLLDADLLDGNEATAFALAGHSHAAGDADTLDGHDSLYFATSDHTHPAGDATTLDGIDSTGFALVGHTHEVDQRADLFSDVEGDPANVGAAAADGLSTYAARRDHVHTVANGVITSAMLQDGAALAEILDDDGAGSLLDADLLDGNEATAFALSGHTHEVDQRADIFSDAEGDPANVTGTAADGVSTYAARRDHAHTIGAGVVTSAMLQDGAALAEILDDDGTGSLLDADLLDGQHAAAFEAAGAAAAAVATHEGAADPHTGYLLASGTRILSGDWDIGAGRFIAADEIRARSASGLALHDDSGNLGIFIEDGGQVGIGTNNPTVKFDVVGGVITASLAKFTATVSAGDLTIEFYNDADANVSNAVNFISYLKSSTAKRYVFNLNSTFSDVTDASRTSLVKFNTLNAGAAVTPLTLAGGNVGIWNTSPQEALHVGAGADASGMSSCLAIFTNAGATALNVRDSTNDVEAQMYAGSTGVVLGAYTNDPVMIRTNNTTAIYISTGQRVGISDTTPDGKLDVAQTSTTAAIPTLELEQADLSEEFINFVATVGVGNPIEAVGSKTLTTTHFIRVQIEGVGYVYLPVGTIA